MNILRMVYALAQRLSPSGGFARLFFDALEIHGLPDPDVWASLQIGTEGSIPHLPCLPWRSLRQNQGFDIKVI